MPKVKPLGPFADRKDAVKKIIKSGMARSGVTARDLERRKIINSNTLGKRKQESGTSRLEELWRMDTVLHFTNNEILQFFGRGEKDA